MGNPIQCTAVLDEAHVGHIHGAFGTIQHDDIDPCTTLRARFKTLMNILGPGLIVNRLTIRAPQPPRFHQTIKAVHTSHRCSSLSPWGRQAIFFLKNQ